jgi:FkbM family methyltransferase
MQKIKRFGIEFQTSDGGYSQKLYSQNYDNMGELENYNRIWLYGNHCDKDAPHPHKTFVSAGGWIGIIECMAAQIYDKVYSLEPDPYTYREFQNNVAVNGYTNVQVDNMAFYDGSRDTLELNVGLNPGCGGTGMFVTEPGNRIIVPCTTLRKYFDKNNIQKNAFLMLDMEGAEHALFDDTEFFEIYKPIILLELHFVYMKFPAQIDRLFNALNKLKHVYPTIDTSIYKDRTHKDRTRVEHSLFIPV